MKQHSFALILLISATTLLHSNTRLIQAIKGGNNIEAERLLTKEKVDPDEPDNEGRTPLDHAIDRGAKLLAKTLLEHKANPAKLKIFKEHHPLSTDGKAAVQLVLTEQRKTTKALELILRKNGVVSYRCPSSEGPFS